MQKLQENLILKNVGIKKSGYLCLEFFHLVVATESYI